MTKQAFILLSALLLPALVRAQWGAVRYDSINMFQTVNAVTPDDAFLIGYGPTGNAFLLRTATGGDAWDSIPFGTTDTYHLSELHFPDTLHGFAGGTKNSTSQALLKTTDGGNTWVDITPAQSSGEPIHEVFFVNPLRGFATAGLNWYATADGGDTWTTHVLSGRHIQDVHFLNDNTGFAAGSLTASNHGAMMKTLDGGATWSTLFFANHPNAFMNGFDNLNVIDESLIFVQHQGMNRIYRSLNGGGAWDTIDCDSVWQVLDFQFTDASRGHVLSGESQLFSTGDGGLTWTLEYAAEWGFYGPSVYFYELSFAGETGFVCGTSGLVKRYEQDNTNGVAVPDKHANDLVVYPNPITRNGPLNLSTGLFDNGTLELFNSAGQRVQTQRVNIRDGRVEAFGLSDVPPGVYTIVLRNATGLETAPLLVAE